MDSSFGRPEPIGGPPPPRRASAPRWALPAVAVAGFVIATGALVWGATTAQALNDTEDNLTTATEELSDATEELVRAEGQLEAAQGTLASTDARLDDANAELAEGRLEVDRLQSDLASASSQAQLCFEAYEITWGWHGAILDHWGRTLGDTELTGSSGFSGLAREAYDWAIDPIDADMPPDWMSALVDCKAQVGGSSS